MSEKRKNIRKAIMKILNGRTAARDNVTANRGTVNWQENLPAINVYMRGENAAEEDEYAKVPRLLKRVIDLEIEIIDEGRDGEELSDKLDDLCEEVEVALSRDDSLLNTCDDIVLMRISDMEAVGDGEKPTMSVRLFYEVRYHDFFPRDQKGQGVGPFDGIDAEWDISETVYTDFIQKQVISLGGNDNFNLQQDGKFGNGINLNENYVGVPSAFIDNGSNKDFFVPSLSSFTIEGWFKFIEDPGNPGRPKIYGTYLTLFGIGSVANEHLTLQWQSNINGFYVRYYNSAGVWVDWASEGFSPDFDWHHVAVVWDGSKIIFYLDGIRAAKEATVSGFEFADYDYFTLGALRHSNGTSLSLSYIGFLDEWRVSNVARYTGNFTPPTAAFENDANTYSLFHLEDNNAKFVEGSNLVANIADSGQVSESEAFHAEDKIDF